MKAVKMKKKNLHAFLNAISSFGDLWGPVKTKDSFVLEKVTDYAKLDLTALRTRIPFKKLLFPPRADQHQAARLGECLFRLATLFDNARGNNGKFPPDIPDCRHFLRQQGKFV